MVQQEFWIATNWANECEKMITEYVIIVRVVCMANVFGMEKEKSKWSLE